MPAQASISTARIRYGVRAAEPSAKPARSGDALLVRLIEVMVVPWSFASDEAAG